MLEEDIRECVQTSYEHLRSSGTSKRTLLMAFFKFFEALRYAACCGSLEFPDVEGASKFREHYQLLHSNLKGMDPMLKSVISAERNRKDQLKGDQDLVKNNKY